MTDTWVSVYATTQNYKALLIQQMLADNEIESVVLNKQDSSYLTFGDIEVHVKRDHIIRAKLLIQEFESSE